MASQGNVYSSLGSDRTTNPTDLPTDSMGEDTSPTTLRHAVETGKARLHEWQAGLEESVRHRPLQAILIAAGVGALIGLLVGRGSSSR